ncbi:MAG: MFS transporter [Alcaligenes sp.]
MTSSPLRLVLTTLCLAVLAAQIDTAVVNLAMRPIGLDLEADMRALQWVLDSYNLAYAALLLTGGLLADLYGRRRTFIAGSAILSVATLMCAAAPSAEILIAARALSGLGAALLVPASLAIIRVAWLEPAERSRVLGIWAACNGLAMALGPTLGGMLIEYAGWRSIFLVVAPIGATAGALAWSCIPESSDPGKRHFDGAAQLSGAAALGMLAFAAIECRDAPYRALAALLAGATALAMFIRIEARQGSSAMVPLAIFRSRPFRGAMAATAGMTFGMYGALFLLPLAWQDAGRFGPLGAGIALMPTALTFVASSPWSGSLAVRHGTRPLAAGGLMLAGAGLLLISAGTRSPSILLQETGLALTGLGMGLATGPLMGAAVSAAPAERSGTASALINVARMMGASLGVAFLGALFAMSSYPADGLRAAMLAGGAIQIACAVFTWRAIPAQARSPQCA